MRLLWVAVILMGLLTLKGAAATSFPNSANISVTGSFVFIDLPGGNDISFNTSTANFTLLHTFTAEYPFNDTVNYDRIEDIVEDAVLTINQSYNESLLFNLVENDVAKKFASQQSWFTQTFMPEVEEKIKLKEEIDTCGIRVGILESSLNACQQQGNLLNLTFSDALGGYRSENTALSWGLSLVMITVSLITLVVVYKVLKTR